MTQKQLIQNQIDTLIAQKTILTNNYDVASARLDSKIADLNLLSDKTDDKTPAVFPVQQQNPFSPRQA